MRVKMRAVRAKRSGLDGLRRAGFAAVAGALVLTAAACGNGSGGGGRSGTQDGV